MSGFYGASDYARSAFILLLINICIHVVSFGSPYWTTRSHLEEWELDADGNPVEILIVRSGGNAGLWEGCTEGECYERYNLWVPNWLKSTQTFFTLALICMFFTLVLLILYIFHRDYDRDKRVVVLGCVLAYIAAFFTLMTWIVWLASSYMSNGEQMNWPFFLAIISGLFNLVIALFITSEVRRPLLDLQDPKPMPLKNSIDRII